MKMNGEENIQALQRRVLFGEIFANVKLFSL